MANEPTSKTSEAEKPIELQTISDALDELYAKQAKLLGCPPIHLFPVDEKSLPRQTADENVFGDTEIG